jgi:hypothetical protein
MVRRIIAATLLAASCLGIAPASAQRAARRPLPHLRVSESGRFLVTEDGRPFFYLGDTAWELFHRLTREEAVRYLQFRADQGYTAIQAVASASSMGSRFRTRTAICRSSMVIRRGPRRRRAAIPPTPRRTTTGTTSTSS